MVPRNGWIPTYPYPATLYLSCLLLLVQLSLLLAVQLASKKRRKLDQEVEGKTDPLARFRSPVELGYVNTTDGAQRFVGNTHMHNDAIRGLGLSLFLAPWVWSVGIEG